ncbi:hypothetical protein IP92_00518 [Pseudoduganella flava]|uniref:MFS transporter n=1 Tax=Pseudoduganella flava TaxID=871742 RepID=A0A562Q449_9BURK|nr:hypothetical protein [Pseudoduganella flava]QGZ41555.1 hypothetical protein GO485_22525 [Pseudoduganella flava]TWI51531.1 hypothetical protein IP92_00518 [Pseudoduganella flava]
MKTVQPSRLLKSVFLCDAAASGAIATAHLLLPAALHEALGLPRALLAGTGIFLALYVLLLVALANSRAVWHALALFVVAGHVGWAAASVALLMSGTVAATGLGTAYVLAQALGVLAFAALEWRGLAQSPLATRTPAALA